MDDSDWFAVIDAARDARLHGLITASRSHTCLFSGDLIPALAASAPWLVRLQPGEPLFEAWKTTGRGQSWGIMCRSDRTLAELRKHFRRFLQARMPDSRSVFFRFYDPRVFNVYIRAATPEERAPWFSALSLFAVESADADTLHNYTLRDDRLFDADTPLD